MMTQRIFTTCKHISPNNMGRIRARTVLTTLNYLSSMDESWFRMKGSSVDEYVKVGGSPVSFDYNSEDDYCDDLITPQFLTKKLLGQLPVNPLYMRKYKRHYQPVNIVTYPDCSDSYKYESCIFKRTVTVVPNEGQIENINHAYLDRSVYQNMCKNLYNLDVAPGFYDTVCEVNEFPRNLKMVAGMFKSVAGASFGAAGLLQAFLGLWNLSIYHQYNREAFENKRKNGYSGKRTHLIKNGKVWTKYVYTYTVKPMHMDNSIDLFLISLGLENIGVSALINLLPGAQLFVEPFARYSRLDGFLSLNTVKYDVNGSFYVVSGVEDEGSYINTQYGVTSGSWYTKILRRNPIENIFDFLDTEYHGPTLRNLINLGYLTLPSIR